MSSKQQCDGCSKLGSTETAETWPRVIIPHPIDMTKLSMEDSIKISMGMGPTHHNEVLEFCSLKCIGAWAITRAVSAGAIASQLPGTDNEAYDRAYDSTKHTPKPFTSIDFHD